MPRQGMCNACGIYLTNNKRQRPLKLAEKLQQQEPWKFRPEVPPGHMLKLKDNGKEVAVPEEDVDDSPRTDGCDSQPPSRCAHMQLLPWKYFSCADVIMHATEMCPAACTSFTRQRMCIP